MTPKPSDIVLIEFPFSNMAGSKRRPALIVREPTQHGDVLAVAITFRAHHSDSIAIGQEDLLVGTLVKPSWVRWDQLHTFDQSKDAFSGR